MATIIEARSRTRLLRMKGLSLDGVTSAGIVTENNSATLEEPVSRSKKSRSNRLPAEG
jgi:hypothetical protein